MTDVLDPGRLDAAPLLELPTDHRRAPSREHRMDRVPIRLSSDQVARLSALARAQGADLSISLVAVFAILLHRYSGQDEFAVGVAAAPPPSARAADRALRVDLSGRPSYRALLSRMQRALAAAPRMAVDRPVLPAMFLLASDPDEPGSEGRLQLEGEPRLELGLLLRRSPASGAGGLEGVVQFAVDLFGRPTIEALVEHFDVLLDSVLRDPDGAVSHLELLRPRHRAQFEEWNSTFVTPSERCIHQVLEDQARAHPDAVAVVCEQTSLTYGQLNTQANQLAHHLIELGIGRGSLVALCVERGVDMVVGILGILKAGAAYVPIDALLYPPERIAFVLADADVELLVTQRSLLELVPTAGARVLCLDDEAQAAAIGAGRAANPAAGVELDDLAYVIYTSGSTGTPKGVMVEHRGLANLLAAIPSIVDVSPHDRHLQFAPVSFDMSIGDILLSLCFGATLCIAPLASLRSGEALARQLQAQRITHATVAPSVLARIPDGEEFPDLTAIAVAAETCPAHTVARWAPGRRFFNVYGPTETTIAATVAECTADTVGDPPIGRPIPNVRVHVVDQNMQLVPVGVPGELCIGGAGVTRGYLGRPELTAERFVPDPFGRPGERIYRTGDRVRWRPDGNLEFLGRFDDQVKLRGYRIELGEIEATLRRCEEVREVAVVLGDDPSGPPGARQLVAYVVADPRPSEADLREQLGRTLPYYMVPKSFVWLDHLPLTPNGKVDRHSLPAPDPGSGSG